jgi:hypothetical protein
MRRLNRPMIVAAAVAVVMALGIGLVAALLTPPVEAGPCRCPLIYAPVICDHGKTFPNPCVAECRGGKNCVPTGEL